MLMSSPVDSLPVPGWGTVHSLVPSTDCLRAYGLMKTPGELEAASLTHRRP